jgi:hypothetical protein
MGIGGMLIIIALASRAELAGLLVLIAISAAAYLLQTRSASAATG